jgi:hypothetical protein
MLNPLRRAAPVVMAAGILTAGLALAAGTVPAQAASTSGYGVTIAASGNPPSYVRGRTYGYALIGYHRAGTIKGTVTGATAGDVVTLLAEPFGAHSFGPTGKTTTLAASGSNSYSFSVQPSLVTRYEVRVSTNGVPDATSKSTAIYVMPSGYGSRGAKACHQKTCTFSYTAYVFLPAPAYHTETTKHMYFYLAQWKPGTPAAGRLALVSSGRAGKPRRISAHEYSQRLTWHFNLRRGSRFAISACTKDSLTKDGIGLPSHHHCGSKSLSAWQASGYLG